MSKVETVVYKGMIFRRYPESKRRSDRVYFKRTIGYKAVFLHRLVYEDNFGPIPNGMHVHHKDGNTGNNSPDNLELLTPKQHAREHITEERIEFWRKNLDEKARHKAAEWHSDPANREFHVKIGHLSWQSFEPTESKCMYCGSLFLNNRRGETKFCSNKCKSAARRKSGIDDVERVCKWCHGKFVVNKYSKQIFCCRSCKMKNQYNK